MERNKSNRMLFGKKKKFKTDERRCRQTKNIEIETERCANVVSDEEHL